MCELIAARVASASAAILTRMRYDLGCFVESTSTILRLVSDA